MIGKGVFGNLKKKKTQKERIGVLLQGQLKI